MNRLESLLGGLRSEGRIGLLDVEFARLMVRLGDDLSPAGAVAVALASQASSSGHLCVDLSTIAGRRLLEESEFSVPPVDELVRSLLDSGVAGRPGSGTPLVVDEDQRLYLYRYWRYESHLAAWLTSRGATTTSVDEERLSHGLARYFPPGAPAGTDWQKVAAAVAALKPCCVISGGPGTGKTTTVLKILALLQAQSPDAPLRIALAAPTGKAARRLQQSIAGSIETLSLTPAERRGLPTGASTLHRLLGATADPMRFRHDRENPLPYDVVVVDEASMIDVSLMFKLVDALAPRTRLVLLGDKDQLASVEAGAVLADLCGDADGFSPGFSGRVARITGETLQGAGGEPMPMSDSIVILSHSYRFSRESGIGALAESINRGEVEQARELLAADGCRDVAKIPDREGLMRRIVEGYGPFFDAVRAGAGFAEVISAFERFRVLCALRHGPFGVEEINRAAEQALEAAGFFRRGGEGYPGMPLMITRNDYNLQLFNGDIGILLPREGGGQRVFFPGEGREGRRVALSRLEQFETAYAMTVHKSQGSEFDEVVLVLPDLDSPVLSRELLYTAVTRARRRFGVLTAPETLGRSISRRLNRLTGLRNALWKRR